MSFFAVLAVLAVADGDDAAEMCPPYNCVSALGKSATKFHAINGERNDIIATPATSMLIKSSPTSALRDSNIHLVYILSLHLTYTMRSGRVKVECVGVSASCSAASGVLRKTPQL